ncbi:hypothetical protein HDU76_010199, partial [Blyttiomyces sp. JEL0837]
NASTNPPLLKGEDDKKYEYDHDNVSLIQFASYIDTYGQSLTSKTDFETIIRKELSRQFHTNRHGPATGSSSTKPKQVTLLVDDDTDDGDSTAVTSPATPPNDFQTYLATKVDRLEKENQKLTQNFQTLLHTQQNSRSSSSSNPPVQQPQATGQSNYTSGFPNPSQKDTNKSRSPSPGPNPIKCYHCKGRHMISQCPIIAKALAEYFTNHPDERPTTPTGKTLTSENTITTNTDQPSVPDIQTREPDNDAPSTDSPPKTSLPAAAKFDQLLGEDAPFFRNILVSFSISSPTCYDLPTALFSRALASFQLPNVSHYFIMNLPAISDTLVHSCITSNKELLKPRNKIVFIRAIESQELNILQIVASLKLPALIVTDYSPASAWWAEYVANSVHAPIIISNFRPQNHQLETCPDAAAFLFLPVRINSKRTRIPFTSYFGFSPTRIQAIPYEEDGILYEEVGTTSDDTLNGPESFITEISSNDDPVDLCPSISAFLDSIITPFNPSHLAPLNLPQQILDRITSFPHTTQVYYIDCALLAKFESAFRQIPENYFHYARLHDSPRFVLTTVVPPG